MGQFPYVPSIIAEAARREEALSCENVARIEAGLYDEFRAKGMTVHDVTPDQVAERRACSASVLESYIANNTDLARQLMAAYGKLRTAPCCTGGPETGGSFSRW